MIHDIAESERSIAQIDSSALEHLSKLAQDDFDRYVRRDPARRSNLVARKLCVTLCQGAALHYLDGTSGVKDFDVFTFFSADGAFDFPPRRRSTSDFGPSKFRRHPHETGFEGRRVDFMGRSIAHKDGETLLASLRNYLSSKRTRTAWLLSQKAMIIIDPIQYRGTAAWPLRGGDEV